MSNIITVRTLSQLPRITDSAAISADTLFEVCPVKDRTTLTKKYYDAGVTYDILSARINSDSSDAINKQYDLTGMSTNIESIINSNRDFYGEKKLTGKLQIRESDYDEYSNVVTEKNVNDIMASSAIGFITSSCTIHTLDVSKAWKFSETHMYQTEAAIMNASGNLYVYGWLADQGNIAPAQAWVALEAQINGSWTKIALCPWSISSYSKQLGYVSFTVPVAKDLNVRIAAGFAPNTTVSGSQNVSRSLTDGNGTAYGFRAVIFSNS